MKDLSVISTVVGSALIFMGTLAVAHQQYLGLVAIVAGFFLVVAQPQSPRPR